MSWEAYSIALKLKLVENVSVGLIALSSQFKGLNTHVSAAQKGLEGIEGRLRSIKMMGLAGGALFGAGAFGLSLFKGPLEEAAKFDQQVQKFKLYGLGDAVNEQAVKFAKSMNIIGTSYVDAMKLVNETQGIFRESGLSGPAALDGAKLAAPMMAKINFATESLDDESKARMRTSGLAMQRFIEMRGGLKSADAYNRIADAGWKAIQTSGGNISWEQLRQFMATGGVAAQGLTDTALFGSLEPIIGEMKGSRAGNALMTASSRLNGIVRVPNQVARALVDAGVWDPKKIEWNKQGGIKRFIGNPLIDAELLATNPAAFYDKDFRPMYDKQHLSLQARGQQNAMFFNRTGGAFFSLYDRQGEVSARSVASQAKALGIDASVAEAAKTLQGKQIDFQAKWNNLMNDLGTNILPKAVKALEGLTSAISGLTNAAEKHPTVAKAAEVGALGLSGVGILGGVALLARAGLGALGTMGSIFGMGGAAGGAAATGAAAAGTATIGGIILPVAALAAIAYGVSKAYDAVHEKNQGSWVKTPSAPAPVQVTTHVNIDGQKVATAVSQHQVKGLTRPQTGASDFDSSMHLSPAGGSAGF